MFFSFWSSYLPDWTRDGLIHLERSSTARITIKQIVLGEGLAYYTHYHEGNLFSRCYCELAESFLRRVRANSPVPIAVVGTLLINFGSETDHGAIRAQYPQLFAFLSKGQNTRCPDCISLGPEGSYFISVAGMKSLQCPPNTDFNLSAKEVKRLWWGIGGSYIAELQNGSCVGDLRGHYAGLEDLIQNGNGVKVSLGYSADTCL